MALPVIVTRTDKGSALTFGEADANFTNLRDAVITVGDGTNTTDISLNGAITFQAGTGITVSETNGTITIENTVSDTTNFNISDGTNSGAIGDGETINISGDTDITVNYNPGTQSLSLSFANGSSFITASGTATLTNKSGNISQWTNDSGYLVNVSGDTTPQLGGDLTGAGNTISNVQLEDYKETIYSLGNTDSPSIDVANGNVQSVTITSSLSLPDFTNAETGQSVTLIVSGSGSASGTANYKFANAGSTTLTNDSIVSIFYDGTTYWTSIATDFTVGV
jgi:hypothetical protein